MAGLVIVASAIAAAADLSVIHPGTGAVVRPVWTLLLVAWTAAGLTVGPGAGLYPSR